MNKGQMRSSSSGMTVTGPLPSAPPSYEEAIGLPTVPTITTILDAPRAPPYPIADNSMPMPTPILAPTTQILVTRQQRTNATQPLEVRVTNEHVTPLLASNSVKITCPSCHADVKTNTVSEHQPIAHLCCVLLCMAGCCFCSCLPYCLNAFLSVHHVCPNCKAFIGTWKG
ncbi:PREDICTED: lipopolysaccharide-induced tumor necrosis factor-alpha factor homolog [Ceratosolen solmsi marchali]|uniref:Lipopolysaccharide-induced tumor necrosis factor-alpha factor homolog n=1 Tax=Ceratosolen solmsi marchali TaxID=326594 RepID=A0AAJ6YJ90_9HYME|nr:PREDICTED: lipopolysaccharide-induced tumor necrosis factor-alpha factor homolog [Ceratosolen solmsi marchali]